jgi:KamA family protein
MFRRAGLSSKRYRAYGPHDLERILQFKRLSNEDATAVRAVAAVLPFRVNDYIIEQLIHWDDVPEDPIYQMTFPQPGMLKKKDFEQIYRLVRDQAPDRKIRRAARSIQRRLNPHPAGQLELNVPELNDHALPGMQHKYRETVLFFPSQGQTCHAYCTFCFRWPQFVGIDELKFQSRETQNLCRYLRQNTEVSDVLITGGDPLVMRTSRLRRIIEPLLNPELGHVVNIRIGTKATSYWPFRFLTDPDADDLLRLFEEVRRAGRLLALMAHVSHPRELEPDVAQRAMKRIRKTGAIIRCQAPLIKHINDDPTIWAELWRREVRLGAVPYYMFVQRDTGAKHYFEIPLAEAYDIFRKAYCRVSGLARTVRGPSMSATPGKVVVQGVTEIAGEKVFVLSFDQGRDPAWVRRPFFARYDPAATWLGQLKPAFGQGEFFFDPLMRKFKRLHRQPAWRQLLRRPRKPILFGHVEWE